MKTRFIISIGYSNIPALKAIEASINEGYKTFGGEGKIAISGRIGETIVTSTNELSREAKERGKEIIKANFTEHGFTDVSVEVVEEPNLGMLTLNKLKEIDPQTCFAEGTDVISDTGKVKWKAIRGEIWDWTIYIGPEYWSDTRVSEEGDKLYDYAEVKRLVPCDDEAFKMYRD